MPEELENQVFLNAFAKRVKSLRKEKGITQLDLAVKTGIDERQIQRIEAARASTGIGNVYQIALAFDITLSELFDFNPEGEVG